MPDTALDVLDPVTTQQIDDISVNVYVPPGETIDFPDDHLRWPR